MSLWSSLIKIGTQVIVSNSHYVLKVILNTFFNNIIPRYLYIKGKIEAKVANISISFIKGLQGVLFKRASSPLLRMGCMGVKRPPNEEEEKFNKHIKLLVDTKYGKNR